MNEFKLIYHAYKMSILEKYTFKLLQLIQIILKHKIS